MALRVRRRSGLIEFGWRARVVPALASASVAILLPLATFLVTTWLLGWQLQAVRSASMVPTYPIGSLLVTAQIDASDVRAGMPIVFEDPREPGRIVTHRVLGPIPEDASAFRTKGDANAAADPFAVPARLVRGRVLWQIAGLGGIIDWLGWPNGFVLFVLVPGLVLVITELADRRRLARASAIDGAGSG